MLKSHKYSRVSHLKSLVPLPSRILILIFRYLGTCLVGNTVSIFMQYVPGGSIAGILKKFGPLNEEIVSKYTKQLLEGVQYIHAKDVIHRYDRYEGL